MSDNSPNGKSPEPAWAWAPYRPDRSRPWNLAMAGHLYRRAAFGANWAQLRRAVDEGPERTIERLLRPEGDLASFNEKYDAFEAAVPRSDSTEGLRPWWLMRAMQTPHPLLEKMTLFWHGHLGVSGAKVKNSELIRRYVQRLRSEAMGRFDTLLHSISHDPALLVSRDAVASRKALPCDHVPREFMTRTCLGPGNFTDEDVREAARAYTGWFVLMGKERFIPREHDEGEKCILGETGNFGEEEVIRLLLKQPATPRRLVRKLYGAFISETDEPSDALIAPLAESFGKDYDIAALVERMLRSNLFFSSFAYRRRIKSPVEFALGIVAAMETPVSAVRLGEELAALGQNVYEPPTSAGWPGGRLWINDAASLGRVNLAFALLAAGQAGEGKPDPAAIAKKYGFGEGESAARFLVDLFLQGDIDPAALQAVLDIDPGDPATAPRRTAHLVAALPEFQLA